MRRGNGRIAQPTIGGLPQNDRPVILQPTGSGERVGGSHGAPPISGDRGSRPAANPGPQVEAGPAEDEFVVYRASRENPLDAPAVWRYSAKNALRSPAVPAVDAFRKLVIESEQQVGIHNPWSYTNGSQVREQQSDRLPGFAAIDAGVGALMPGSKEIYRAGGPGNR